MSALRGMQTCLRSQSADICMRRGERKHVRAPRSADICSRSQERRHVRAPEARTYVCASRSRKHVCAPAAQTYFYRPIALTCSRSRERKHVNAMGSADICSRSGSANMSACTRSSTFFYSPWRRMSSMSALRLVQHTPMIFIMGVWGGRGAFYAPTQSVTLEYTIQKSIHNVNYAIIHILNIM